MPSMAAEFESVSDMKAAIVALHAADYGNIETYTPLDLPVIDEALGASSSRLGWFALGGGLAGLIGSYAIQWWANVHAYPMNVGGRPVNALPAFLLSMFESAVLGAGVSAFAGFMIVLRLPRLWDPIDEISGFERATVDRFWISLQLPNEQGQDSARLLLTRAGAVRVVAL